MKNKNQNSGFIRGVMILIVAFVTFSFFVDIKSSVNTNYIKNMTSNYKYLKAVGLSLVNKVNFISKKQTEDSNKQNATTTSSRGRY